MLYIRCCDCTEEPAGCTMKNQSQPESCNTKHHHLSNNSLVTQNWAYLKFTIICTGSELAGISP